MLMIAAPWPRSPRSTEASINAMWVIVAGVLVMFMPAGFLLLEVGFSRVKNAGAGGGLASALWPTSEYR
jgi:hypothetical protein